MHNGYLKSLKEVVHFITLAMRCKRANREIMREGNLLAGA